MEALESLNLQAIVAGQDYERQLERLVSIVFLKIILNVDDGSV